MTISDSFTCNGCASSKIELQQVTMGTRNYHHFVCVWKLTELLQESMCKAHKLPANPATQQRQVLKYLQEICAEEKEQPGMVCLKSAKVCGTDRRQWLLIPMEVSSDTTVATVLLNQEQHYYIEPDILSKATNEFNRLLSYIPGDVATLATLGDLPQFLEALLLYTGCSSFHEAATLWETAPQAVSAMMSCSECGQDANATFECCMCRMQQSFFVYQCKVEKKKMVHVHSCCCFCFNVKSKQQKLKKLAAGSSKWEGRFRVPQEPGVKEAVLSVLKAAASSYPDTTVDMLAMAEGEEPSAIHVCDVPLLTESEIRQLTKPASTLDVQHLGSSELLENDLSMLQKQVDASITSLFHKTFDGYLLGNPSIQWSMYDHGDIHQQVRRLSQFIDVRNNKTMAVSAQIPNPAAAPEPAIISTHAKQLKGKPVCHSSSGMADSAPAAVPTASRAGPVQPATEVALAKKRRRQPLCHLSSVPETIRAGGAVSETALAHFTSTISAISGCIERIRDAERVLGQHIDTVREYHRSIMYLLGDKMKGSSLHSDVCQGCNIAFGLAGLSDKQNPLALWLFFNRPGHEDLEKLRRLAVCLSLVKSNHGPYAYVFPPEVSRILALPPQPRKVKLLEMKVNKDLAGDDNFLSKFQLVEQRHGDLVTVQPGCLHDVKNLQPCIKLAWDCQLPHRMHEYALNQVRLLPHLNQAPHSVPDYANTQGFVINAAAALDRSLRRGGSLDLQFIQDMSANMLSLAHSIAKQDKRAVAAQYYQLQDRLTPSSERMLLVKQQANLKLLQDENKQLKRQRQELQEQLTQESANSSELALQNKQLQMQVQQLQQLLLAQQQYCLTHPMPSKLSPFGFFAV